MTKHAAATKALSVAIEEQTFFLHALAQDALTVHDPRDLCRRAQQAGDVLVSRLKARLDAILADVARHEPTPPEQDGIK